MATLYDWIKLLLDNKWILILALSTITSLGGNVYGYFEVEEKNTLLSHKDTQIGVIAEAYRKEYINPLPKTTPDKTPLKDVLKRLEWIERQLVKDRPM